MQDIYSQLSYQRHVAQIAQQLHILSFSTEPLRLLSTYLDIPFTAKPTYKLRVAYALQKNNKQFSKSMNRSFFTAASFVSFDMTVWDKSYISSSMNCFNVLNLNCVTKLLKYFSLPFCRDRFGTFIRQWVNLQYLFLFQSIIRQI